MTILANDDDPDGDLDISNIAIVTAPSYGAVDIDPSTGRITFTPAVGFAADRFSYTVQDDQGAVSNVATVTVDVNQPPVAKDDRYNFRGIGSTTLGRVPLSNDADPDGLLDPTSVAIVTPPAHGLLEVTEHGVTYYGWDAGFLDTDSYSYTVRDNEGAVSNVATVTLQLHKQKEPPVAHDDVAKVLSGQLVAVDVLENDIDPDGFVDPDKITIITGAGHGVARHDLQTRTVLYQSVAGFAGHDTFRYAVDDNDGAISNVATVNLSVVLAMDDAATVLREQSVAVDVLANDFESLDPASVAIVSEPGHGTASVDPSSGLITYTPDIGFFGADSFTYRAEDDDGVVSNVATVNLAVVLANDDSTVILRDQPVVVDVLANDSHNLDPASVAIVTAPARGVVSIDRSSGSITYTPAPGYYGPDNFTYTAVDSDGVVSNVALVSITVRHEFTSTSPTAGGLLPTSVSSIGGIVLDLIGLNGSRVVSQLPASKLFRGYFDGALDEPTFWYYYGHGGPAEYRGNPGILGIQEGFHQGILDALGGGLSEVAVRFTFGYSGTPTTSRSQENVVFLNGITLGGFSDVITLAQTTQAHPWLSESINQSGGFRRNGMDTGFFYSNDSGFLESFYGSLSGGQVIYQLWEVDLHNARFDFVQGLDGNLMHAGLAPNVSPVARDDEAATSSDTAIVVDVLANDEDPDGSLNSATVVIASGPANGNVEVDSATGRISYDPASGFSGTDIFEYVVSDDDGAISNVATVTIEVAAASNRDPIAENDTYSVDEDVVLQVPALGVLVNDSDVDDDTLAGVCWSTLLGTGVVTLASDGSFRYTPRGELPRRRPLHVPGRGRRAALEPGNCDDHDQLGQ